VNIAHPNFSPTAFSVQIVMFKTVLSLLFLVVVAADHHDENFDYYDINAVYNQFYVSCGSPENPYMRITYGGDAFSVYAAEAPEACKAEEVAPAVFLFNIEDFDNTDCPVKNISTGDPDAPVRMLDVVVQSGSVRKWTDDYKQITCNYGLGGQIDNNEEVNAKEGAVDKRPVWQDAINMTETTTDSVHLHVYDTSNNEIDEAVLGNYIQLRAFLANGTATDNSIKIFNCRAFDDALEYYFLIGGCGEGDIMSKTRGFRTAVESPTGYTNVSRVARSTYFKSFLLPDKHHLTFECDYILCDPSECDGYSCSNSIMLGGDDHRRKRSVGEAYPSYSPADVPASQKPTIRSKRVTILPQENQFYRISANDIVHAGENNKPSHTTMQQDPEHDVAGVPEVYVKSYVPQQNVYQQDAAPAKPEDESLIMGMDLVTVGLIAGMSVLALLIIVTLSCTIILLKQQRPQMAGYHHTSLRGSPHSPVYTGPPVYNGPPSYKA